MDGTPPVVSGIPVHLLPADPAFICGCQEKEIFKHCLLYIQIFYKARSHFPAGGTCHPDGDICGAIQGQYRHPILWRMEPPDISRFFRNGLLPVT